MCQQNKTRESAQHCAICHSSDFVLWQRGQQVLDSKMFLVTTNDFGNFLDLWRCRTCGFVFENISAAQLEQAYKSTVDTAYLEEERGRQKTANRILAAIEQNVHPGELLDVGCFTGTFLAVARERGWQVRGVELSVWAVQTARERYGLDVQQGTLDTVDLPPHHFDLVTLIDVIEHLPQPMPMLERLHRLVKEDGYVYLSTPNVDSLLAKVMGRRWWSYRVEHTSLFCPSSLRRALLDSGFDIVETWVRGRDFTWGYWMSKIFRARSLGGRLIHAVLDKLMLNSQLVYLDFHDQIDILARKRHERKN